jgi:hypothetical protein
MPITTRDALICPQCRSITVRVSEDGLRRCECRAKHRWHTCRECGVKARGWPRDGTQGCTFQGSAQR